MSDKNCSVEGCEKRTYARGMCSLHYRKNLLTKKSRQKCTVGGCERPIYAKGLCQNHYVGERKWGDFENHNKQRGGCSVPGCTKPHHSKGFCREHYGRFKNHGDPLAGRHPNGVEITCTVKGCDRVAHARGFCTKHYQKYKKYGDPLGECPPKPAKYCSVEGCNKLHYCRGYCSMHYARMMHSGDINLVVRKYIAKYPEEHTVWLGMKARCNNPKHRGYKDYGGRGISVCKRWEEKTFGFKNFMDDMGPRPEGKYPSGFAKYSIDRIDNDGNYEPSNCRWADAETQSQNKRKYYPISSS